jgi:DNA polymerase-1
MNFRCIVPFYENKNGASPALFIGRGHAKHGDIFHGGGPLPENHLIPANDLILFEDAKASQKQLLASKIEIVKPLCLATLYRILGKELPPRSAVAGSLEDAKLRAQVLQDELCEVLEAIEADHQQRVAHLECLATRAFASMEFHGLRIEQNRWQTLIDEAQLLAKQTRQVVCEHFEIQRPSEVSLFSDEQGSTGERALSQLLDSSQYMKPLIERVTGKKIKDTRRETLAAIDHPAVHALLLYREQAKLVSTYGKRFLEHINPNTGRIHASFDPLGTASGRSSCANPNLQNLPSDSRFHACVVAPNGRALVTADYSACELRVLAGLSEDPALLAAFEKDNDVHSEVAATMFGVPVSKTENAHLRKRAKAINFGLMYGMSPRGLAHTLECSEVEAEKLFTSYFKAYPKVARYLEGLVDSAVSKGYAETTLGRRLFFENDVLAAKDARWQIARVAKNMPIQGSAAEIMKLAMVRLQERLSGEFTGAFFVNMIHDELVLECDDDQANALAKIVKLEMEDAMVQLLPRVRAKAEVNAGREWKHD